MAHKDEIASTERLLNVIRGEGEAPERIQPPPIEGTRRRRGRVIRMFAPTRRAVTVGVELVRERLRLFKLKAGGAGRWNVLDYQETKLTPVNRTTGKTAGGRGLHQQLREKLAAFCGGHRRVEIWAWMDTAGCDIRRLQVPRVARRRLTQAVYWGLRKGIGFDDRENLFDYEVLGPVEEGGIPKTEVLACTVPRHDVQELKALFDRAGFPLKGVTLAHFALRNVIQALPPAATRGLVGVLDIGEDGSRIDIFNDGRLVFTRSVRAGMASIFAALMAGGLHEGADGNVLSIERDIDTFAAGEDALAYGELHGRQLLSLLTPTPQAAEDGPSGPGIGPKDVLRLILPTLERLVRQAELSFSHYAQGAGADRVARVFLAGELHVYKPLLLYIQDQLGVAVQPLDRVLLDEALNWRKPPPEDPGALGRLLPALSAGLRNRHTPNLFATHTEREKTSRVTTINRGIFIVFLLCIAVGLGIFYRQEQEAARKKTEIARLEAALNQHNPRVSPELLQELVAKVQAERRRLDEFAARYGVLAVLHEVAGKTPEHIRLVRIAYADQSAPAPAEPDGKTGTNSTVSLTLEGVVLGDGHNLDIRLGTYLAALGDSGLLQAPVLERQGRRYIDGDREVLHFIVRITNGKESI